MSLRLSKDEIAEITGKVQPAAQLRELRRVGIKAFRQADPEHPVLVLRAWLAEEPAKAAESAPRLKSEQRPS